MDVDRKRSKGGFLHLFDWPGKSRKKLFSNSSEPSEESKQGKENAGNISISRLPIIDQDETRTNSSNNARSDFSCASSVTSDEGHGTGAPSVVARLMGLDSLPVPNAPEPRFNPILDPYFLRTSHHYEHLDYVYVHNNLETIPQNHVESRPSKPQNRLIEKFQTEMLPPKSAKPIPVTHNRLLSPIRSPRFVPTKNPAYIVEVASRIIEPSPRVITKTRVSTVGSSSFPLRIRDSKETLDAAHKSSRPQVSNDIGNGKYPRERQSERRSVASSNGTIASRVSAKAISDSSKSKGKFPSLAVQTKINTQREGSTSSSRNTRASKILKEKTDVKNRVLKRQPNMKKTVHKGPSGNTSKTALRHNNQKQNCKDSLSSKTSVPNHQGKKVANKVVNEVLVESETWSGSKKKGSSATHSEKDISLSRKKIPSHDKKPPNGHLEDIVCDNVLIKRGEKSIKCNVTIDGDNSFNKKKDMDVISFTFSSPIKGLTWDPQTSSTQGTETEIDSCIGSFGASSTCANCINIIAGDALSVLLEQKLRELTCKIESSNCDVIQEETSESTLKESLHLVNGVIASPSKHDKWVPNAIDKGVSESLSESECISFNDQAHDLNRKCQVIELGEAKEQRISSISCDAREELDYLHSSPTSDLGPFCSGSCTDNRENTSGIKQSLFSQDPKSFNWVSSNESWPAEDDNTEFSESASSISMGTVTSIKSKEPSNWELQYISNILNNSQLMLERFTLGNTRNIISPGLFDQLEDGGNPRAKIEGKTIFDCVSQCLELECEHSFTGSFKGWAKQVILYEKKDWLAEELYKEIMGWKSMGELMVDELVDKDMSSLHGKWIDYEKEEFEEGIEIEKVILSSLVDDLVYDLLVF